MTLLQDQESLQSKIRHTAAYDDTLSATSIAKRHKVSIQFVKKTLANERIWPGYYQAQSKRYKIPVEEVCSRMESGLRYCPKCKSWNEEKDFQPTSNQSMKHKLAACRAKQEEQ